MPKVPRFDEESAPEAPVKPSLEEIKADVTQLKADLETYSADSPALRFAVQKLGEATTGIQQHLHNIIIEAQMAARDAERKAKLGI